MAAGDLTDLAAVRVFMQKPAGDTDQDGLISSLISPASRTIIQWAGRQFAPAETAATHRFAWEGGDSLDLTPYDLRSATLIQIDTDTTSPTTLSTPGDYDLEPFNTSDSVYTTLTIPRLAVPGATVYSRPGHRTRRIISITGDWGFASVPADVRHACNVTIKWWIENDVSAFSSGFDANTDQFTRGEALPQGVRRMLAPYRRITVA